MDQSALNMNEKSLLLAEIFLEKAKRLKSGKKVLDFEHMAKLDLEEARAYIDEVFTDGSD